MPSVKNTRAAIAATLTNIAALTTAFGDYRVSAYPLANPTPPQIEVAQFGIVPFAAMNRGAQWWTCVIRGYLAVTTDVPTLEAVDNFLENDPVTTALEANATLTGNCDDLIVDRVDQRFWDHPDGKTLAGCEWALRILV